MRRVIFSSCLLLLIEITSGPRNDGVADIELCLSSEISALHDDSFRLLNVLVEVSADSQATAPTRHNQWNGFVHLIQLKIDERRLIKDTCTHRPAESLH
jgi:hypothetical protein